MNIVDSIFKGRAQDKAAKEAVRAEVRKTQDIGKEAELVLAEIRAQADAEANEKDAEERKAAKAAKGG